MIKGLHHVGFAVDDLNASVEYYKSLNFEEINRFQYEEAGFEGVMMKTPGYGNIELFRISIPDHELSKKVKRHMAFETDDLDGDIQKFLDEGCELAIPVSYGKVVKRYAYVKDVQGNFIELLEL